MTTNRLIITGALLFAGLLIGPAAQAQSVTSGAIQGVVTDKANGNALAGVTVVATSPALQGTQSAITGSSGQYKITNLPPGTYSVAFYYAKTTVRRTNIEVHIGRTTPAFVKIDTSKAGGEVITIKSQAPAIDPTSTAQGVTLDQNYTRNIPVPGRTFEAALGAAAGSAGDDLGVSFSGSTSLENSYVVDGVNTTGVSFGTVGSPILNDFIQEIQIITGGYQAEYGRSTGGVVNVVTKSGTNHFHGSVFGYLTPGTFVATADHTPSQSSSIDATSNLAYDANVGFEVGGPVIKDKLWFYAGFAPRIIHTDITRYTKRQTDCRKILPDGKLSTPANQPCTPQAAAKYGDGTPDVDPTTGFRIYETLDQSQKTQKSNQYQFVSKLNYAASADQQGQVSFTGTPANGNSLGVRGVPSATDINYSKLTTDVAGKWTSKFDNDKTELNAVVGWHRNAYNANSITPNMDNTPQQLLLYGNLGTWGIGRETPKTVKGCTDSGNAAVDPYPHIDNCPDYGAGYLIGGPGSIVDQVDQRYVGKLSATERIRALGHHEIKGGVDVEDNHSDFLRNIAGGGLYTLYLDSRKQTQAFRYVQLAPPGSMSAQFNQDCGTDPTTNKTRACKFITSRQVNGDTLNWAGYLQDSWQIVPNLTFNAGVRYEEQKLRYAKYLQGTVDPLTGQNRGTNAIDMSAWAPRVGLLYDWTKEGRSKVYASYGRFYESIPLDINNRAFGGETDFQETYSMASCGSPQKNIGGPPGPSCDKATPTSTQIFGTGELVEPGIRPQYLDELIVGAEYELMPGLKVGLSYHNRRLGRIVEDVSTNGAQTYVVSNPGEFSSAEEARLQSQINGLAMNDPRRTQLENELKQFEGVRLFDKASRNYDAFELTATKQFSDHLFAQASYTYQRTRGNYPGLYQATNGQVDPNAGSAFDLIELLANRYGPLPQDRPNYFKLDSYYNFDFHKLGILTTGVRFRALSGTPITALGKHYEYGFGESFVLPRGSIGRTPFNWDLDLHVAYGRRLGKGMQFQVFTDLFNVFNNQGQAKVDENYTYDSTNPISGGTYQDLVFAKKVNETTGLATKDPIGRNPNFGHTTVRYAPFSARIGARLIF